MRIAEIRSQVIGHTHIVEVVDDSGTTGLGQSAAWAFPHAVHAVVETFRPALLGADPTQREHIWHHMYRMGPFRGSILMAAVSAVDIALWDLLGKMRDMPIYELLGGAVRDRLRLHLLILENSVESLLQRVSEGLDEGFTALKFDPLPPGYQDMTIPQLVYRTRETVGAVRDAAPEADIILEMHRSLTPAQALSVGAALKGFNILFWEDPLQIDTISKQSEVARSVGLPIGLGERNHTIWEFEELLAPGGVQFIRPDIGLAGGFSQLRKIAAVAEAHHATVVLHNFLGPIQTAASAQLGASIPNFLLQEYYLADEEEAASHVFQPLRRDGGYLKLPEGPGLGVQLADELRPIDLIGRDISDIPFRADGSVAFSV